MASTSECCKAKAVPTKKSARRRIIGPMSLRAGCMVTAECVPPIGLQVRTDRAGRDADEYTWVDRRV